MNDSQAIALPRGTVTFMFTDIEGSTRLWETQKMAMQEALARHDALLRAAIEASGGHVFKTVGDAFCAVFTTAPDALAGALHAQRALHAERWPDGAPLRVRMALHSGIAELRDADYFGATLNRVARLLAAAHGGQTLLSESTHDLARDHLPAQASVKPLGEHGLKDLARREAVFQLCHPALQLAFPPLKATQAPLDRESPSIAVLPFVNMSRDEENEYFADGLSEELLNVLAKIRGVRVASRTSAFWFKGKDVDIPTVAQKLNVATVLEGSVRKSGRRVRVTAQLIEVASDSHLWSETYDRELDDIFAVQDDIAQAVVSELRARLLGSGVAADASVKSEVQAAAAGRADDPEAHRLYLQGRYYLERMTGPDVARGVELFRQAIALDENFALGWTGLSRAYAIQAGYGWAPVAEGYERARDAAKRALTLNDTLADAHVCLGRVLESHDWNWHAAAAEYQRALALAPENVDALRSAAGMVRIFGDIEEAIVLVRKAAALDPLSPSTQRALGLRYFFAERLDEAMTAFEAAADLNPKAGLVHAFMAATRAFQGRGEEALRLAELEVLPEFRLLGNALGTHVLGRIAERDTAMRRLAGEFGDQVAYQLAELYAWFGDAERALEWLERGYVARDPGVTNTLHDPFFKPLHRDPRWQPFLDKMGFPRQVSGKSPP
jgi:TolB-like protein/class 3 adenylate cyclase